MVKKVATKKTTKKTKPMILRPLEAEVPSGTSFGELNVGQQFRWRDSVLLGLDEIHQKTGENTKRMVYPHATDFDIKLEPNVDWDVVVLEQMQQLPTCHPVVLSSFKG